MNKIGIMQGRVIPERLDRLQVFPASNWTEEILKASEIGFECVELLFDKESNLEKLLDNSDNFKELGLQPKRKKKSFVARSVCMDYLSSLSLLKPDSQEQFFQKIAKLIHNIKGMSVDVLVIPFFDSNSITKEEELSQVLNLFEENELDEKASEGNIVLALELSLSASQIQSAFKTHSFRNIAICFDLGNARGSGFCPEEEISVLNKLIAHVHIKDKKVNGPNVMLGEGDVDFSACLKSLKEIDYGGQFILETPYKSSPLAEAKKNLQFIQETLKRIES